MLPGQDPEVVRLDTSARGYTVEGLRAREYIFRVWDYRTFDETTFQGLRAVQTARPLAQFRIRGPTAATVATYTTNVDTTVVWSLGGADSTAFVLSEGILSFQT